MHTALLTSQRDYRNISIGEYSTGGVKGRGDLFAQARKINLILKLTMDAVVFVVVVVAVAVAVVVVVVVVVVAAAAAAVIVVVVCLLNQ